MSRSMSNTPQLNRQPSWHSTTPSLSRFREHLDLSISPPAPDHPVEKSQFSPESLERVPLTPQGYLRSLKHAASAATKRSARTPTSTSYHHHHAITDLESAGTRSPRSMRDRVTQFFFDIRTLGRDNGEDGSSIDHLPMQDPWNAPSTPPPAWPPLHVEKRPVTGQKCACGHHSKRSRTTTVLFIVVVIILFYLLVDSVFVTASIIGLRHSRASPSPTSTATTGNNVSAPSDAQACLTQYMLNAPSSPSTYPCDTCLPLLQNASPADLAVAGTNSQYATQTAADAVQFCALRAVFASAAPAGQSALGTAGWVRDVRFCAWQGVTCDGSGKVSTLKLAFPAVPAVVPAELGALSGLTTLSIIGDGNSPSGKLPGELTAITSFTSLHLESTAMSTPPDISSSLTSLQLIKNAAMSPTLPPSLFISNLATMIINSQALTNPLAQLSASSTLQASLRILDLTQTQLTGAVPGTLTNLRALTEIHLDGNALTGTLPKLGQGVVVTATNNTGLQGA